MESTSAVFDRDETGGSIPPPRSRDRDGLSALERKALYRVHTELPAMPASLVVQILLWPEKMTDWARDESVTPALVYNMLGGFKPYHGLRERLAQRLGVTKAAVDHLIDARRQQPSTRRIPEPPPDFVPDDVSLATGSRAPDRARAGIGGNPNGFDPQENAAPSPEVASQHADEPPVSDAPPEQSGPQITFEL
jgi:hypothetical protein